MEGNIGIEKRFPGNSEGGVFACGTHGLCYFYYLGEMDKGKFRYIQRRDKE
ncbi:hypothetical protein BAG01nite_28980 [Brevibacillus agri]|uniref:Uncharacterized protein n=1 Tax=Brevibacillus agri TaxID=51101 RepID=A0ABQ0SSP8_9BACL|nr:hypothetical protein BAG01nite_28980 [Brevibacillus agri]